MFKKNKKQTENVKEKKVRTVKVGTHKKTVIALWVVLIASVSFGVYKNFTAIDQHTTHEKEIIELRLQDTNGIENFVKNFAKSYYTWNNSKEAIESRTQAINGYLTTELQDLNVDTIRTDIPTSSTVTDVTVSYTHLIPPAPVLRNSYRVGIGYFLSTRFLTGKIFRKIKSVFLSFSCHISHIATAIVIGLPRLWHKHCYT